eukprot:20934-Heterococcus_DN1.PRE.2
MAFLDERELFTETLLSEMLAVAASSSKWLRQRGAEWPDMLWHGNRWDGEVLQWARAEGCTSLLLILED